MINASSRVSLFSTVPVIFFVITVSSLKCVIYLSSQQDPVSDISHTLSKNIFLPPSIFFLYFSYFFYFFKFAVYQERLKF